MYSYDTVSEAVNGLKTRGFELDFNLQENCLICHKDKFDVNDFEIVEVYRFEGNSDPSDEAVVKTTSKLCTTLVELMKVCVCNESETDEVLPSS